MLQISGEHELHYSSAPLEPKRCAGVHSYVELSTRHIASVATSSKIVVEKSTVPCRTAQSMRTILEANSRPGCRFDILSNPEFLAEGTAISDLFNPDRVLIGSLQTPEGKAAQAALTEVYCNWVPKDRVITTGLWSSELSKLVSVHVFLSRFMKSKSQCALHRLPTPFLHSASLPSTLSLPSAKRQAPTSTKSPMLVAVTTALDPNSLKHPSGSAAHASRKTSSTWSTSPSLFTCLKLLPTGAL